MTDSTNAYFIYESEQTLTSVVGSWTDLPSAITQAGTLFPSGQWIIKDATRTVVQRWDGSTS